MYKFSSFHKSPLPNQIIWPVVSSSVPNQNLVEDAGLGRLLDLLGVDFEHGALVLAHRLGVGLLRVDPELALGLAGAGQPLLVGGIGAVVVQVDLVLLGADQGKGALGCPTRGTRRGQGQKAVGCAGNVDVCCSF